MIFVSEFDLVGAMGFLDVLDVVDDVGDCVCVSASFGGDDCVELFHEFGGWFALDGGDAEVLNFPKVPLGLLGELELGE